jgi:hypothetical protein
MQAMEPGRREFARRAAEMQGLIDKGNLAALLQRATSDSFTFGPAGSGEQLRQEQVAHFFSSLSPFFFLDSDSFTFDPPAERAVQTSRSLKEAVGLIKAERGSRAALEEALNLRVNCLFKSMCLLCAE